MPLFEKPSSPVVFSFGEKDKMDALNKYELAQIDYSQGMKQKDIAEKHGVSINTVKSWKKRYNWQSPNKDAQLKKEGATKKRVQPEKGCKKKKGAEEKTKTEKKTKTENRNSLGTFVLNENQRLFCQYYLNNRNATQAYIKAYGCGFNTANVNGPRLLVNTSVRSYIDELLRIKREAIQLEFDDLFERQMRIAFADMTDFVEFGRILVPMLDSKGIPLTHFDKETQEREIVYKLVNDVRFKESTEIDGGLVCQVKLGRDGATLKLEDRQKALDWLANNMALANEEQRAKIENLKANTARLRGEDFGDDSDDGFMAAMKSEAKIVWEE